MNKNLLIVISAPSGCGKDALLEIAMNQNKNLFYSVSATTRSLRAGEIDGKSYYFYSKEQFEDLIKNDLVLEYTVYCGNYYGTPKNAVQEMLNAGKDVVLKIEVEGAMNIKKSFPEAVLIFILPPSLNELERRLYKRGTENEESIKKRLNQAVQEIKFAKEYDYIVVNDELEKAVNDFNTIIYSEKMSTKRNLELINSIK